MGYLVFDLPVLVVRSFSVQYIGRFAACEFYKIYSDVVHVHLGLVHWPIGSHVHKMTTGQFC